jgi:Uma2 family endonuclease
MSGLLDASPEEPLAFTEQDLAYLPESFPRCVIRAGRIARADGLPLKWEDYQLLEEDFPAVLTKTGELEMAPAPTDTHEKSNNSLVRLLGHYLSCHPGGEVITNRELHIAGYHPAVPDVVFFRHPKHEFRGKPYTEQIPDLTVEILSPSNKGEEWEDKLTLYRERCPEVWLFRLDGSVEVWRVSEPKRTCKSGELFSSPGFPGLAIDPVWMKNYPEEIARIEQFNPEIVVAPSVINPKLTKKARALAEQICTAFWAGQPISAVGERDQTGTRPAAAQFTRAAGKAPRESEPRARTITGLASVAAAHGAALLGDTRDIIRITIIERVGLGHLHFRTGTRVWLVWLTTRWVCTTNMKSTLRRLACAAICAFTLLSSGCFISEGVYVTPGNRTAAISETDIRIIKEVSAQVAKEFGMLPTPASEVEAQEAQFRSVLKGGRIIASYDFPGGEFAMGASSASQVQRFSPLVVIAVGRSHQHERILRRVEELLNQRLGPGRTKLKWEVYANFA